MSGRPPEAHRSSDPVRRAEHKHSLHHSSLSSLLSPPRVSWMGRRSVFLRHSGRLRFRGKTESADGSAPVSQPGRSSLPVCVCACVRVCVYVPARRADHVSGSLKANVSLQTPHRRVRSGESWAGIERRNSQVCRD